MQHSIPNEIVTVNGMAASSKKGKQASGLASSGGMASPSIGAQDLPSVDEDPTFHLISPISPVNNVPIGRRRLSSPGSSTSRCSLPSPMIPDLGSLIISIEDIDDTIPAIPEATSPSLSSRSEAKRCGSKRIYTSNSSRLSEEANTTLRRRTESGESSTSWHRRDSFMSLPQPHELRISNEELDRITPYPTPASRSPKKFRYAFLSAENN